MCGIDRLLWDLAFEFGHQPALLTPHIDIRPPFKRSDCEQAFCPDRPGGMGNYHDTVIDGISRLARIPSCLSASIPTEIQQNRIQSTHFGALDFLLEGDALGT
jgi:hypothetical protein